MRKTRYVLAKEPIALSWDIISKKTTILFGDMTELLIRTFDYRVTSLKIDTEFNPVAPETFQRYLCTN
jgi:hypothetical protein